MSGKWHAAEEPTGGWIVIEIEAKARTVPIVARGLTEQAAREMAEQHNRKRAADARRARLRSRG